MGVPTNIGRFSVKAQASSWGTAETSFASANWVNAEITLPQPVQEAVTAEVMRGDYHAHEVIAGALGETEITLSGPLMGVSAASPSADPTAHPHALLLASVMGGNSSTGYAASDLSGGDADQLEYTAASASAGWTGHALLVPVSGGYSIGWADTVTAGTPDTVDLIASLTAVNSGTGAVYGSVACYQDKTQPTPFTLQWEGAHSSAVYRFADCVVTACTLTLNPREQPRAEFTVRSASWSAVGSGGAPAAYDITLPQMPVMTGANGSRLLVGGSAVSAQASLTMSASMEPVTGHASTQGIASYVVTDRSSTLTIVEPVDGPSSLGAPGASVGVVQLDANTTPGRALSVLVPSGQRMSLQQIGDSGGLVALTSEIDGALYTADDSSTGPGNKSVRVAFL